MDSDVRIKLDMADKVLLFTDLANPTSNSIYQRVGYEPVSDADQWAFGPHSSETAPEQQEVEAP